MKPLPETEHALALRTDFSDEAAWQSLCATILKPVKGFGVRMDFVSDPEFAGLEAAQLPTAPMDAPHRSFVFVIDRLALSDPQHPILVVDLLREPGRAFRAIPPEVGAIADNLELANMDFCDFADAAGLTRQNHGECSDGYPNE